MKFNSIRLRLPVSYGGIALLTVVCLRIVFLFTMQRYYQQQEIAYLERNARALADITASLIGDETPASFLQAQIEIFAIWTQTRIQILDPDGNPVADSGNPTELEGPTFFAFQLQRSGVVQSFQQTLSTTPGQTNTTVELTGEGVHLSMQTNIQGALDALGEFAGVGSLLSRFDTGSSLSPGLEERSTAVVRADFPWHGTKDGGELGWIALSDGPAFGRGILAGVRTGFLVAGTAAVILSTLVGWLISLRLSHPIHELVKTTGRMAAGDLQARAAVERQDEIGLLAYSFNHMADQVEQTMLALKQFVADAAHEIHTPLTALRTNLELARLSTDPDPFINNALDQSSRIEKFSSDLLLLSRLESGLDDSERKPFRLDDLLRELSEPFAAQAEQAGLDFELDLDRTGPVQVHGDQARLSQAVGNLLDNAIKFTPSGGRVRLDLAQQEGQIRLEVADSGIGIPAEDHSLLFQRFHRGRNAAAYPGSGLGLAISQAIVRQHGGEIQVQSQDSGTVFTLILPQ